MMPSSYLYGSGSGKLPYRSVEAIPRMRRKKKLSEFIILNLMKIYSLYPHQVIWVTKSIFVAAAALFSKIPSHFPHGVTKKW